MRLVQFKLVGILGVLLILFPATASDYPKSLNQVGSARMSVLWFDIYDSRLYSSTGQYNGFEQPLLLELQYLRNISQQELIKETERQWQYLQIPTVLQQTWLQQLALIWPSVNQNDQIAFYLDEQGHGHFYFNQVLIGSVADRQFSQAFLNIWLSDSSSEPELTRQLLGLAKE